MSNELGENYYSCIFGNLRERVAGRCYELSGYGVTSAVISKTTKRLQSELNNEILSKIRYHIRTRFK